MKKNKNLNIFDRNIESVDIVFENCEVYKVPAHCIYRMNIDDVKFSFVLHFNGLSKFTQPGEVSSFASCEYASIILNEDGMKLKSEWDEMFKEERLLKDRIKSNDITHFDLNFEDGTHLYISVPWEDDNSEFVNKYQHNDIRDNISFINICKDYNSQDEEEINDESYDFYQYEQEHKDDTFEETQEQFYENLSKIKEYKINVEDTDNKETFNYNVPNYVLAAFSKIDEQLYRVMWNVNQEEYPSPFSNTGEKFKNDTFEVEAYSWDDEYDQEYNFKWNDYKVRWYKHCLRDPQANREITPDECAKMLDECLESIYKMDIDEDDFFDTSNDDECLKCGSTKDLYPLKSGVRVCKECLDNLGKEQGKIREELIDSLFEFGFDNYEDVCNIIETFEDIIKFIQNNIDEEISIKSLINILGAARKVTALQEGLLSQEEKDEILSEFEQFYNKNN